MGNWKLVLTVLAFLHAAKAFDCPDDAHPFYHADVSTGCRVYHRCENSQLQTFTCPSGQAFKHETSSCEDESTVNCYETMGDHSHHQHHKRAIEEYHTIDIQEFKSKVIEAYYSVRPVLKEAIRGIAPSIYAKFEESYLPAIRAAKREVLPFFYEKVYPEIRKWLQYSLNLIGKIIEKAYRSYKLSNSTHITVVSMSDIAEEVSNDLQPVLRLGRYLSSKMLENKERSKREVDDQTDAFGIIHVILEPLVESIGKSMTDGFLGNGNIFINKVVVPVFYEMIENEETRDDAVSILISAKAAFSPLAWEMMKLQTFNTPQGTVIKIPREFYTAAIEKFVTHTKPIIRNVAERHLKGFFRHAAENVPLIEDSLDFLEAIKCPHVEELRTAILKFIEKHGGLLRTSPDSHIHFFPLTEILDDLTPIKDTLLKIFWEYIENDHVWMKSVFGPTTSMKKDTYKYAKPLPKLNSKKIIY